MIRRRTGDRGRPGALRAVVGPQLDIVFNTVEQSREVIFERAGGPGLDHRPEGVGLVGGGGLDVAQVVGRNRRSAVVRRCAPGHGKRLSGRGADHDIRRSTEGGLRVHTLRDAREAERDEREACEGGRRLHRGSTCDSQLGIECSTPSCVTSSLARSSAGNPGSVSTKKPFGNDPAD